MAGASASRASMPDTLTGGLSLALGERVKALRTHHGLSRRALSEMSGISQRYLAQIETGDGNVSILLLAKLCDALGARLEDVILDLDQDSDTARLLTLWHAADDAQKGAVMDLLDPQSVRHRRVALIGLRGAGKSTLGRRAAQMLDLPFVELNQALEAESGLAAADVIALYGQDGYRALEHRALSGILKRPGPLILAAAGGIVGEPATFDLLLRHFYTIWLKAGPEEHMARVRAQGDDRPMAGNPDAMRDLRAILREREASYARADAIVDTAGRTEDAALDGLLQLIAEQGLL